MNLRPLLILLFCLTASAAIAQVYGTTGAIVNNSYTFAYTNGTAVFPTWVISANGTIISTFQSGSIYNATVKWTSAGTGTLTFKDGSTVKGTVSIPVATTPSQPSVVGQTNRCGTGTLTLTATSGVVGGTTLKWYSALTGGSLLSQNSSYTTPSLSTTTNYYVTVYDATSSTESSPRVQVTAGIYSALSAPATSTNGTGFSNASVTLSTSSVSGASGYKWYTTSTGGIAINGVTTNSYTTPVTPLATYYVSTMSGGVCESTARRSVSTALEPNPTVTTTNDKVIMGANVTLDGGAGYATYTWKNSANATVSTTRTLSTNIIDNYTVTVTKTGVSGSAPSASFAVRGQLSDVDQNYIISNTLLTPITSESAITQQTADNLSQTIQYFDGLGRPTQTISTQASPSKKDIVQPTAYDDFGRETTKYLPYTSTTESNGWFKSNPLGAIPANYNTSPQYNFYNNAADNIADDVNPFAVTKLEDSPLQRTMKQGAPGAAWQPDNSLYANPTDHTVKLAYEFNTANEVLQWTWSTNAVSPFGLVNASNDATPVYYNANELYKNKTKDEQNNEVIEYKDKQGRVILKKMQADATTYAQTYYIYDDLGNLVAVIQPEGTKYLTSQYFNQTDNTIKDAYLKLWAFRYSYDARNRMIMKQVPGAEPVYMVYDNRDRVVLTQDGNQRALASKEWNFIKYDILNRPVLTGKYVSNNDQTAMQTAVDNFYANLTASTAWYETYIGSQTGNILGYDNKSFPNTVTINDCNSATYYDGYDTFIAPAAYAYIIESPALAGQETVNATSVRGLATATQVKILGTTTFLRTVNYYDAKHRAIQSISDHQKGTVRTSMILDFAGRVLITKRTYVVNSVSTAVKETFTYDHAGRMLTTKHSITNSTGTSPDVITAQNVYNELGQLVDKKLHSTDGTNFQQSVDYRYNIRGWMNRINNADVSTIATADNDVANDYFGMELGYNNNLTGTTATLQYNGNISAVQWSTGGGTATKRQSYAYGYDMMNRLLTSNHNTYKASAWNSENGAYSENITSYDLNGNINGLTRKGYGGLLMDNLAYTYAGNKLSYVNDDTGIAATTGFINCNTGIDDYAYDSNGNLYKDKNKGISNNGDIKYNYLNLPIEITKSTGEKVKYIYDATGRKLTQEVYGTNGTTLVKSTDYIGELFYEGTNLKFIQQAEGRVLPDGTGWEYQYHLKDHLGNVRVTFTAKAQTATNVTATFETSAQSTEATKFNNYPTGGYINTQASNAHGGTNSEYLNGGYNGQVGLAKSFSVMPGDVVQIQAYAKYSTPSSTAANYSSFVASLLSAFSLSAPVAGETGTPASGINAFGNWEIGSSGDKSQSDAMKAFVTIILFDKNYNFIDVAYQASTSSGSLISKSYTVKEPGYAYLYISNEHPTLADVYFDDVSMSLTPSQIVSVSDYFAFGLQYNNGERTGTGTAEQRYGYNGKELQDELNLGLLDYGARMYQADIGRWGTLDPLDENEYDREMDKEFANSGDDEDQANDFAEVKEFTNKAARLFSPINVIDAETSAVHYNSSPYSYVLNNPLKYKDLFGLDSTKATVLPEVTVTAPKQDNNLPHWLGPGLVAAGQPWIPKRFITPGSSPGTSVASTVLNKVIPIKSPIRLISPVINKSGMRMVATKSVGKFLGRWVPFVGWALTAYDFTKMIAIPMSQGAAAYNEENVKSGNWSSNLPH